MAILRLIVGTLHSSQPIMYWQRMNTKIAKLADTVRMAARTYDNGKRETAIKLISIVASQVKTLEDRQQLVSLVRSDLQNSGIKVYFHSIIIGAGGTSVRS